MVTKTQKTPGPHLTHLSNAEIIRATVDVRCTTCIILARLLLLSLRALLMHLHQPALALLLVPRFFIYLFFFRKFKSFWILILLGVFSTWFPQLQFQRANFAKFVCPHLACEVDHDSTGALNS